MRPRRAWWVLALAGWLLAGCAGSGALRDTGFLRDYSQLTPGKGEEAQFIFFAPDADFADFTRALVDPVVLWTDGRAQPDDPDGYAAYFEAAVREEVGLRFQLADAPGADTLRIRLAITEVEPRRVAIECEILDSASDEVLVAAVDQQAEIVGGSQFVYRVFDEWAEALATRLAAFRDFDRAQRQEDHWARRRRPGSSARSGGP